MSLAGKSSEAGSMIVSARGIKSVLEKTPVDEKQLEEAKKETKADAQEFYKDYNSTTDMHLVIEMMDRTRRSPSRASSRRLSSTG